MNFTWFYVVVVELCVASYIAILMFLQCLGYFRVTDLPHQNTLRTKTRQTRSHQHNKMRDKYIKSSRIDAAIAAIQRGEFSNYATAAAYHKCDRGALSRRMRGLTKSKKDANSFWHQYLTNEQEEVLIARINNLTD